LFINHNGRSSYRDNGLPITMVGPPPTKIMVYQPHWLVLLLHRQLFTKHNGLPPTQTIVYQPQWSSSYTDNCLSTTTFGPPSTQSMLCQPHWLVLLLHIQWFINHTESFSSSWIGKDLATSCASNLLQTRLCKPQYRNLLLSFLLKHILTHSIRILKDYPLSFKSRYRTQV